MSLIYEQIGRLIVRLAWWRFGTQIRVAGVALAAGAVLGGWLLTRRDPPEG